MAAPHYLQLAGTATDIGLAHGSLLAEEIGTAVDFYGGLFGLTDAQVQVRAGQVQALLRAQAPDLATEIEAIADGAGQPIHWLYALNARSELVPFSAPECTAVLLPEAGLQGQTWDWSEQLQPLVTVLEITRPDGHSLLTVTEPGIVGKIGLNSAGLGVTLNFLPAPGALDGLPIHAVLRSMLEADSLADASSRAAMAGTGKAGNVMVGSAEGAGINFEFAGASMHSTPIAGVPFVHTNHCLATAPGADPVLANSEARLARAGAMLASPGNGSADGDGLATLRRVFSDTRDQDHPICRPYISLHGMQLGTVCTVLLDLAQSTLHLRMGPDAGADWQQFQLQLPTVEASG